MEHSVATALASRVLPVPARAHWHPQSRAPSAPQASARSTPPGVEACKLCRLLTWRPIEQQPGAPPQAGRKQLGVLHRQLHSVQNAALHVFQAAYVLPTDAGDARRANVRGQAGAHLHERSLQMLIGHPARGGACGKAGVGA